jgi:hypothetical protein
MLINSNISEVNSSKLKEETTLVSETNDLIAERDITD